MATRGCSWVDERFPAARYISQAQRPAYHLAFLGECEAWKDAEEGLDWLPKGQVVGSPLVGGAAVLAATRRAA